MPQEFDNIENHSNLQSQYCIYCLDSLGGVTGPDADYEMKHVRVCVDIEPQ